MKSMPEQEKPVCPSCGYPTEAGHAKDCPLAKEAADFSKIDLGRPLQEILKENPTPEANRYIALKLIEAGQIDSVVRDLHLLHTVGDKIETKITGKKKKWFRF